MTRTVQFPIIIGLRRSRILDSVLLAISLLAISAFAAWPQTLVIRLAGIAAVVAGCCATWWQLKPDLSFIKLERSGRIFASYNLNPELIAMDVLPGASVHPWLTVIRFQNECGKRLTVLVTHDTMTPEDFRRLRMFLRWRAKFSCPKSDA